MSGVGAEKVIYFTPNCGHHHAGRESNPKLLDRFYVIWKFIEFLGDIS